MSRLEQLKEYLLNNAPLKIVPMLDRHARNRILYRAALALGILAPDAQRRLREE
jgi:hypothetical protein